MQDSTVSGKNHVTPHVVAVTNEAKQFNSRPLFCLSINHAGEQANAHCLLSPEKLNGFCCVFFYRVIS